MTIAPLGSPLRGQIVLHEEQVRTPGADMGRASSVKKSSDVSSGWKPVLS